MNWIEIEDGTLVNLERASSIERDLLGGATIYLEQSTASTNIPYETLREIIKLRRSNDPQTATAETLRKILSNQTTPVP